MSFLVDEMVDNRREGLNDQEEIKQARTERFEQLLDEYEYDRPRRGQIVEGQVIKVFEDMILVDIGAKRDAVIPRSDLSNLEDEYLNNIKRGDKLPVYVAQAGTGDNELIVSLEKGLMQEDWDLAKRYSENEEVAELKVTGYNKGGLLVEFNRLEGFIPNSHITVIRRGVSRQERDETKAKMIGDTLECKVLEVDQNQSRLLFSERDAKQERRESRLEELEKGQVVTGKVVNIVDFGAFVDLGGVDGLIHISELDWERIDHPSEVVELGEEVEVEVMDVDVERERVSLSRKARMPSPWQKVNEKYNSGDLVEGKVTNVRDFGAFVEIPEGVVGLVHVSEIGFGGSGNPRELVKRGDTVLCRIMDIEPEKERMSLSMQRVTYEEQISWMVDNVEEGETPADTSQFAAAMTDAMREQAPEVMPVELVEASIEAVEAEDEGEAEAKEDEVEAESEIEIGDAEEASEQKAEQESEAEALVEVEAGETEGVETEEVEAEAESEVDEEEPEAEPEVEAEAEELGEAAAEVVSETVQAEEEEAEVEAEEVLAETESETEIAETEEEVEAEDEAEEKQPEAEKS